MLRFVLRPALIAVLMLLVAAPSVPAQSTRNQILRVRASEGSDPSWFGYPFTLGEGGAERRTALQRFLLERRIDSRLLLAGNMTRQPALLGREHRIAGALDNTDLITESSLWVGCYPGLSDPMIDWIADSLLAFFRG